MTSKQFALADILSVATGYLVSPRHMDAIYDVMGFMLNDPFVTTIGLAASQKVVSKEIYRQHPDLYDSRVVRKFNGEADVMDWVEEQEAKHGKTLSLTPLPAGTPIEDDLSYLKRVRGSLDGVAVIRVDGNPPTV